MKQTMTIEEAFKALNGKSKINEAVEGKIEFINTDLDEQGLRDFVSDLNDEMDAINEPQDKINFDNIVAFANNDDGLECAFKFKDGTAKLYSCDYMLECVGDIDWDDYLSKNNLSEAIKGDEGGVNSDQKLESKQV